MNPVQTQFQAPTRRQKTPVGREGLLRLRFEQHHGQTCLAESYFRTPLQVMRSIPDPAGCLAVYLLTPTGGVVQHDRYELNIQLADQSHGLVTTVAATKVFRMPHGQAKQLITIDVGPGALLEFVPDPLILFQDSDFEQDITINLQPGALCLFHDAVMGGRVAHQNGFWRFRQFRNQLRIQDANGLIAYESVNIQPQTDDPARLGLLDNHTCWGSAYLVGAIDRFNVTPADFCRAVNANAAPDYLSAISTLHRNGFAFRILANRLEQLDHAFASLRQLFRAALDIPYTPIRK